MKISCEKAWKISKLPCTVVNLRGNMIEMNGVAELSDHNFITSYDIEHIVGKAIYVCTDYFFFFSFI